MEYNTFDKDVKKWAVYSFCALSILLIIHRPQMPRYNFIYHSISKNMINFIERDENLKSSQIIQNDGLIYEMSPYSYKKKFKIKNYCQVKYLTEYDLWNISGKVCPIENAMWQARRNPDVLKDIVDENTYTYIKESLLETINKNIVIKTSYGNFYFDKYKCFNNEYCFWKVSLK
jgi:hypothetical protein